MDDVGCNAPALGQDDIETNLPDLAIYEQELNGSSPHPFLVQENPGCQYPSYLLAETEGGWPDLNTTWCLPQNDGTGNDRGTFGDQTMNHLSLVQPPGSCNDCFQRGSICEWHQLVFLHSLVPHSCSKKDEQGHVLMNISNSPQLLTKATTLLTIVPHF